MAAKGFKIALVQMLVGADKAVNVQKAVSSIAAAAKNGAQLVVLPEVFNAPYGNEYFPSYAEEIPGPSTDAIRKAAKKEGIYLIGGSIPEKKDGRLYNSCPLINPKGELCGVYRKIHLFDIDVPGGIRFQESETLSPGCEPTVFKTEFCNVGIGICYDVRFPELAKLYNQHGCQLLVYPGAFNMTTGPAHWELLSRGMALNNQVYTAVCSPARDTEAKYVAWGHSMLNDPWGTTVANAEAEDTIIYADIGIFQYLQRLADLICYSYSEGCTTSSIWK